MKTNQLLLVGLFLCMTISVDAQINLGRKHLKDRNPHIKDYITKIVYDYNDGEHHTLGDTAHVYFQEKGDLQAIANNELLIVYHQKTNKYALSHLYFGEEHIVEDNSSLAPAKQQDLDDLIILEWEIDGKVLAVVLWKKDHVSW